MSPGIRFIDSPEGECLFLVPRRFQACTAGITKYLLDPDEQDDRAAVRKLHWNQEHNCANKLIRILVDAGTVSTAAVKKVDAVAGQCDACGAFDKTPHVRAAACPPCRLSAKKCKLVCFPLTMSSRGSCYGFVFEIFSPGAGFLGKSPRCLGYFCGPLDYCFLYASSHPDGCWRGMGE